VNFTVVDRGIKWSGQITILMQSKYYICATINARGSEYKVCVVCYFANGLGNEYAAILPHWDFGCRVDENINWNFEQLKAGVDNKVDRATLAAAISSIINLVGR